MEFWRSMAFGRLPKTTKRHARARMIGSDCPSHPDKGTKGGSGQARAYVELAVSDVDGLLNQRLVALRAIAGHGERGRRGSKDRDLPSETSEVSSSAGRKPEQPEDLFLPSPGVGNSSHRSWAAGSPSGVTMRTLALIFLFIFLDILGNSRTSTSLRDFC